MRQGDRLGRSTCYPQCGEEQNARRDASADGDRPFGSAQDDVTIEDVVEHAGENAQDAVNLRVLSHLFLPEPTGRAFPSLLRLWYDDCHDDASFNFMRY